MFLSSTLVTNLKVNIISQYTMIIAIKYNPSAILVRRHITLRGKAIIHITSLLKSIYSTLTCMYKNLGEITADCTDCSSRTKVALLILISSIFYILGPPSYEKEAKFECSIQLPKAKGTSKNHFSDNAP